MTRSAFAPISHLTVGEFREWLLDEETTGDMLAAVRPALTPEMAAAVSKIMRVQDLVTVGAKTRVITRFRDTIGLPGRLVDATAAESSNRRSARHRGQRDRRIAVCEWRRGDRRQSGLGRCRDRRNAAAHARPHSRNAGNSHANLRSRACDHANGGVASRRAGRPGVSIHRRNRSRESRPSASIWQCSTKLRRLRAN